MLKPAPLATAGLLFTACIIESKIQEKKTMSDNIKSSKEILNKIYIMLKPLKFNGIMIGSNYQQNIYEKKI